MEMNDLELVSIKEVCITKVNGFESTSILDILSVEEPLEIRISYGPEAEKTHKNISVTMRTPGNDFDLAIGFLFTEGIITSYQDVKKVYHTNTECSFQKKNIVQVDLVENFIPHLMSSDRNFYTTSSCGVCGKSSIQSIKTVSTFNPLDNPKLDIAAEVLYQLSNKLKAAQSSFAVTGGIHASGLFTIEGDLVFLQEDVGRHNALDKLIGSALANNLLPLNKHILLLSGRASFELIQKAAMAGISVVVAIGAPSSLAVELAREFNITLFGFIKEDRFNIYNSSDQVVINF
ncbi:formate dehydrogenase accessory sulfurtransferase FdhD [Flavobacterium sp. WLB]|uniref:formate dehydrogenase accessory sulfurtransferase FdhD n=1 Tax=unclassified Flavobacterium TaxID=196869 RepID=UPI0006ABB626|nr:MULTISPECIES: formate dehydrogenase accessory sulfurtransferase FdhD [unclassified Flavobacterium]KOP39829.1 formate dehydrogenase [Flavobacterium sp. VMW]OWU92618.1 formate dehydrogenase family accessory protein FdhD [Flavobacterium sp. NLM]PUU68793.1 formate dehydrogenase accessory sulfurtransferase FdhD [Flavobacterium sp. WLB]